MQHALELLAILMLMAVGQCVVDPSPRLWRRALYSFAWGALAFTIAIVIISIPSIAATAAQLAAIVLAIYMLRWIVGGIVDHFCGPLLIEMPRNSEIAAAAARVTGVPFVDARRIAPRILRRNEGYIALAALNALGPQEAGDLEASWQSACDETREGIMALARSLGGASAPDRVSTSAVRFLAQALCIYEGESVKRALGRLKECRLASRAGRDRVAGLLEKQAQRSSRADQLGIPSPLGAEEGASAPALSMGTLLWPALGILRLGFRRRALVITITQALLILYGLSAIAAARGFTGNSGYVFLGVALLVHVQTLLALGDFADVAHALHTESEGAK